MTGGLFRVQNLPSVTITYYYDHIEIQGEKSMAWLSILMLKSRINFLKLYGEEPMVLINTDGIIHDFAEDYVGLLEVVCACKIYTFKIYVEGVYEKFGGFVFFYNSNLHYNEELLEKIIRENSI